MTENIANNTANNNDQLTARVLPDFCDVRAAYRSSRHHLCHGGNIQQRTVLGLSGTVFAIDVMDRIIEFRYPVPAALLAAKAKAKPFFYTLFYFDDEHQSTGLGNCL